MQQSNNRIRWAKFLIYRTVSLGGMIALILGYQNCTPHKSQIETQAGVYSTDR